MVLVETAERADEIDRERALRAKRRAEEIMAKTAREDVEYVKIQAAMKRAISRLKVAERS